MPQVQGLDRNERHVTELSLTAMDPCASGMDTEIFKTVIFNEYEKDR